MTKTIIHVDIYGKEAHCLELENTATLKKLHINLGASENILAWNQQPGNIYYYFDTLAGGVPKIAFVCMLGHLHHRAPTTYYDDTSQPGGTLKSAVDFNGFPMLYVWAGGRVGVYYVISEH